MNVLFLHNNFPGQYLHIAPAIARDPNNVVVFGTKNTDPTQLEGVHKVNFAPAREASPNIHHYVRPYENAVLHGQAVYRLGEQLKAAGFIPDVVCAHSGWGVGMFIKDTFPQASLLSYFEWFGQPQGADLDFDPAFPLSADDVLRIHASNAALLMDLYRCDHGISPTVWQRSQFPREFHSKITVLHDGVDTDYFHPIPGAKLVLPNLDLAHVEELVTFVARGMDSYRGFPQFIQAIALVLKQRPHCHVVIVGSDRVAYGPPPPGHESYKSWMLERVSLDLSRVHFVGLLNYGHYKKVLQASSVHVYLTRPFVLSWSLMEAMSSGCLILGSKTPPVQEVIEHGVNGLLVDFFDVEAIASQIEAVLTHPTSYQELRVNARKTICDRYARSMLLPKQIELIKSFADLRA
ncbi:MAG TPA: glycosyltransferase family 4 protein [Synechococcales cyanobacterium M55_K2018_004]|nr:glycosyltransferase family 4 protein [Synechococcales cyanobacterium M55_K2018_004]